MQAPLAERLRPRTIEEYIGQTHLVGDGSILRRMIDTGHVASFILWGPPGVGKTTLARIIANTTESPFYTLSAVHSGVKEVREVLEQCKADARSIFSKGRPILFIDEIHRFNKSQQDSLLGAVENGTVTLIGATTENPSFEVIRPLLSRAQVYVLKPLEEEQLQELLQRAITTDEILKKRDIRVESTTALFRFSGGDARKLLNILDLLDQSTPQSEPIVINDEVVTNRLQENPAAYDKSGEMHYGLLARPAHSRRRGSKIHSPPTRNTGRRGHRPRQPQRASTRQRDIRHHPQNRLARGTDSAVGMCHISCHIAQEQLGLHGHRRSIEPCREDRQPARAVASAQRTHQTDERARLRQELQVCPRLSGQLRATRVHARGARTSITVETR